MHSAVSATGSRGPGELVSLEPACASSRLEPGEEARDSPEHTGSRRVAEDDGNTEQSEERIAGWIRIIVPDMPPGSAVLAGRKPGLVIRHTA